MPHRDERLPKTEEARVMSHDPLIPDDTEEDRPMFSAQEVLAMDAAAKQEEQEHGEGLPPERGRDTEANEDNATDPDESANVANDERAGEEAKALNEDKPKARSRAKKDSDEEKGSGSSK